MLYIQIKLPGWKIKGSWLPLEAGLTTSPAGDMMALMHLASGPVRIETEERAPP